MHDSPYHLFSLLVRVVDPLCFQNIHPLCCSRLLPLKFYCFLKLLSKTHLFAAKMEGIPSKARTLPMNLLIGKLYRNSRHTRAAIACFKECLRSNLFPVGDIFLLFVSTLLFWLLSYLLFPLVSHVQFAIPQAP